MKELLTTKELADFLRLNEKKIYQLVRDAGVPHVRIAGKWLFPRDHIERWIDEEVHREKNILLVGSDDMLMSRLLAHFSQRHMEETLVFYSPVGSLNGIKALAERKGHACCTHLLDVDTGEYNLPFLRRYLAHTHYVVVNLWYRRQGLVVPKGNPRNIGSLVDIVATGARFVNRNKGSGTRLLTEYVAGEGGLAEKDIVGFDDEANSHMEVALRVLYGQADAGLGIEYLAHVFPLDCIPLREEQFDLVVPKELWPTQVLQRFIAYIDPVAIGRLSDTLAGYDLRDTGKVVFEN
jgi:excisionase family DNA binding protein